MAELCIAAREGDVERILQVINDFDDDGEVQFRDKFRFTPLHYAAMFGHAEACGVLLDNGVELNWQGLWGNTALHHAAMWGQVAACKLLLERGARYDLRNNDGATPADCAGQMCKKDGKTSEFTEIIDAIASVAAKAQEGSVDVSSPSADSDQNMIPA
jgi:hypothetical protein